VAAAVAAAAAAAAATVEAVAAATAEAAAAQEALTPGYAFQRHRADSVRSNHGVPQRPLLPMFLRAVFDALWWLPELDFGSAPVARNQPQRHLPAERIVDIPTSQKANCREGVPGRTAPEGSGASWLPQLAAGLPSVVAGLGGVEDWVELREGPGTP
jgi:hypothetical protein